MKRNLPSTLQPAARAVVGTLYMLHAVSKRRRLVKPDGHRLIIVQSSGVLISIHNTSVTTCFTLFVDFIRSSSSFSQLIGAASGHDWLHREVCRIPHIQMCTEREDLFSRSGRSIECCKLDLAQNINSYWQKNKTSKTGILCWNGTWSMW